MDENVRVMTVARQIGRMRRLRNPSGKEAGAQRMSNQAMTTKPPSNAARFFAATAILTGLLSFLIGGLKGRRAGGELLVFVAIAVLGAVTAIAMRQSALSYVALGGAALAFVGIASAI